MNNTIELLKIIGSPLVPGITKPAVESWELYNLAVKNKISLFYLETLKQQGKVNLLKTKYDEELTGYNAFVDTIAGLAKILETLSVNYVFFKTIRPYPAVPSDIDLLILDKESIYRKTIDALLRASYPPQTPGIVEMANLTSEEAYKKAVTLLTKPTFDIRHVSPTGTDFLDPKYGIDIDLQKDIAMSYVIYFDKNKFTGNTMEVKLINGERAIVLTPEYDLATVIAHSLMEQLYLLGEFYTFLFILSKMDDKSISNFIGVVKENRLKLAASVFASITADLHKEAYGSVPEKLECLLDKLGFNNSETRYLRKNDFNTPHRYKSTTVIKVLLEKMREQIFRRGVITQIAKTLDPRLAKLVTRELAERQRRETYLAEK